MENTEPEYIYHYTRTSNLFLILPSMSLKMGKLEETNDPRERLKYFEGIFHGENFPQNECIQLIEDFLNNYPSITCFSGDNSDKMGFNLPTMWANYADKHKGICLKINTKKFHQENENLNCKLREMNYLQMAEFNRFEIFKETTKEEILKKLVFLKRDDWSSENEWRLFSLDGKEFCSIANSLESIILGIDFNYSFLPAIDKLIEGTLITIQKVIIDERTQNFFVESIEIR